jgi:hypothetical protein
MYQAHLLAFLPTGPGPICLESSWQIKKAPGLPRGKIDAPPLAGHQLWHGPLAMLPATRQGLLRACHQVALPLATKVDQPQPTKARAEDLPALPKDGKAIDPLIQADPDFWTLMTWVPRIGAASPEWQSITDPQNRACHPGVAPFEYHTRVGRRAGLSQHAPKRLKSLFHWAAIGVKG